MVGLGVIHTEPSQGLVGGDAACGVEDDSKKGQKAGQEWSVQPAGWSWVE